MVSKREMLLDIAVDCAAQNGLENITFQMIGDHFGCRPSLIAYHFDTVENLRLETVERSVYLDKLDVVAQAAVTGYDVPYDAALRSLNYIAERFADV